jgi:hypothetical protein
MALSLGMFTSPFLIISSPTVPTYLDSMKTRAENKKIRAGALLVLRQRGSPHTTSKHEQSGSACISSSYSPSDHRERVVGANTGYFNPPGPFRSSWGSIIKAGDCLDEYRQQLRFELIRDGNRNFS